ncbi:MAG: preprotein translocase subunit SecE [Gemmatimonadaceae bacterium]
MAVPVPAQKETLVRRSVTFYHDVMGEMRKVTWPDMPQVRQLSIGVILLSLFIGGLIAIMDVVMQQVLVRWIPSLFGG